VRTRDPALLTNSDLEDRLARLHDHAVASCKFGNVELAAAEYRFENVPETVAPGVVSFKLSNRGRRNHELGLYRVKEDVEFPTGDLTRLPRSRLEALLTPVDIELTPPGARRHILVTLSPGDYLLACFQPLETADGPPHYTRGMFEQFKVA
jgi:hypothetical protein